MNPNKCGDPAQSAEVRYENSLHQLHERGCVMTATAVITLTFYTSRLCFNPPPLIKDTISELRILHFVLIWLSQQVNQVGVSYFYLADKAGLTEVGRNTKL